MIPYDIWAVSKACTTSIKPIYVLYTLWLNFLISGIDKIDSLTISIPSEGIEHLGIGDHSSSNETLNEDSNEAEIKPDPVRAEFIQKFLAFWNTLVSPFYIWD